MKETIEHIKNYIELHTSDMENSEYVEVLNSLVSWAEGRVKKLSGQYKEEDEDETTVFPII